MNIDEKKLKELQDALPSLNELDVLECLWNSDTQGYVFDELVDKYLIDDNDGYYYPDDSERIENIRPYIKEWFGEHYAYAIRDGEYIMLCHAITEDDVKYWDISKINVDNQEIARKIAFLISFVAYENNRNEKGCCCGHGFEEDDL